MTKTILFALFLAVAAVATPALAANCCVPGAACCEQPCCK